MSDITKGINFIPLKKEKGFSFEMDERLFSTKQAKKLKEESKKKGYYDRPTNNGTSTTRSC